MAVSETIAFTPDGSSSPPFKTQFTAAEGLMNLSVLWSFSGQRWFCKIDDSRGSTLIYRPLIGSPPDSDINLIASISASSLVYREQDQTFEITL